MEKIRKVEKRKQILGEFTMMRDVAEIPITNELLDWRFFNSDYYSHDREYKEVE